MRYLHLLMLILGLSAFGCSGGETGKTEAKDVKFTEEQLRQIAAEDEERDREEGGWGKKPQTTKKR